LPFFGVTFIVVEHVPAFSVFTELPLALQIFLDDAKTVMEIFEDDGRIIFAFFAKQAFEIVFPFFTEQFAGTTTTGGS
jgi:hypothetical protein